MPLRNRYTGLIDKYRDRLPVHDDTRIILVHGGYFDLLATSEIIRPFEHVLLDLSLTITRLARSSISYDISFLLESFNKRICIGSDFPEGNMITIFNLLKQIGVDKEVLLKNGILGLNIKRFFSSSTNQP